MKQYSLPDMLPYQYEELSYGTSVQAMKNQAYLLDRQVLFGPLFNDFYLLPELKSFQLEVKLIHNDIEKNENEFEPQSVDPTFSFSINKIITVNEEPVTPEMQSILTQSFNSFDNYLSGKAQEKVLLWIWKRGKESNLVAKRNNGENLTYTFEINKDLSVQLCKDAYQENYPVYYQKVLEQLVPKTDNNPSSKNKI